MGEPLLSLVPFWLLTEVGKGEEGSQYTAKRQYVHKDAGVKVFSKNRKAHFKPSKIYTHSNNSKPMVSEKSCENTCSQRQDPAIELFLKPYRSGQPPP